MVNSPLIRPYFWGGGLTSHETRDVFVVNCRSIGPGGFFVKVRNKALPLNKKKGPRVLKGPGGVSKGRGCSWGTLRIPFGNLREY